MVLLPVPLAAEVITIHGTLLVTAQGHPEPAVKVMLPVPPPRGDMALTGLSAYVQVGGGLLTVMTPTEGLT